MTSPLLAGLLGGSALLLIGIGLGYLLAAIRLHPQLSITRAMLLDRERQLQQLPPQMEKAVEEKVLHARAEFQALAEKLLRERTQDLQQQNTSHLNTLLSPLKEQMGRFATEVQTTREKSIASRTALEQNLHNAVTELRKRTEEIGREADALARAFRGENKAQGNWGELVLEGILAQMGLIEGTHFDRQKALRAPDGSLIQSEETGRLIPDILLHYADGRSVVVDSKVSLTAYTDFINAPPDSPEQAAALKQHIESIRRHVTDLAGKNYTQHVRDTGREPADFAILFIPNEGSFHTLIQTEPKLWDEAYKKNILLVSPVLLPPLLHLIHIGWVRIEQERNQEKILKAARELMDRLYHFYELFTAIGVNIEKTAKSYQAATAKLRDGNQSAIKKGEELKRLSVAETSRTLPVVLAPEEA